MKANSPSQSTTSIDKVKSVMRMAGIEFMEIDDYMVITRSGRLVSFNPMTSDDDAILLAGLAGLSVRRATFMSDRVIGFYFSYEINQWHNFICEDAIKACSVKGRFITRKSIVEFIHRFGVNKAKSDEECGIHKHTLELFISLSRGLL